VKVGEVQLNKVTQRIPAYRLGAHRRFTPVDTAFLVADPGFRFLLEARSARDGVAAAADLGAPLAR